MIGSAGDAKRLRLCRFCGELIFNDGPRDFKHYLHYLFALLALFMADIATFEMWLLVDIATFDR